MYDDEESLYGDHNWSGSDSGDFAEEADLTEASAEELLAEFGKGDTLGAIQGYREERIGYDERMGGITGADLQLRRVQGQSAEVQQAIKNLTGSNWRKNSVGGVNSETDATRVRAERAWNDGNVGSSTSLSQFSDRIKVDTNAFAGDVYARNGSVLRKGGVQPKHYKKARNFLEGIGANIDMGPGGKLTGVTGDEELDAGHSNELNAAFQFIDRLADKYIPQATKDSRVYGARKEAVVGALTNRMVDGRTLKDSTGYYHNEKKKLASPADLNVAGLIDNKAWGKGHTDWVGFSEFSQEEWNAANLANSIAEQAGTKLPYEPSYLVAAQPSPLASLNLEGGVEEFRDLQDEYARHAAVMGRQLLTIDDENRGNYKHFSSKNEDPEQLLKNELYNDAAIQDQDMETKYLTPGARESASLVGAVVASIPEINVTSSGEGGHSFTIPTSANPNQYHKSQEISQPAMGYVASAPDSIVPVQMISDEEQYAIQKDNLARQAEWIITAGQMNPVSSTGTERGGMYGGGDKISDRNNFVEAGLVPKPFVGPIAPEQGGDIWHGQREGIISGSIAGQLFKKNGISNTAADMADKRLGNDGQFVSNHWIREGNKYEHTVNNAFEAADQNSKYAVKRAFFVEGQGDWEGFGVSPDASLLNPETGKLLGLAEYKFLASDQTQKQAVEKYKYQMQMQMAVTGAPLVEFMTMNAKTNRTEQTTIYADPDMQSEILARAKESRALSESLDAVGVSDLRKTLTMKSRKAAEAEADVGPATVITQKKKSEAIKATVFNKEADRPTPSNAELIRQTVSATASSEGQATYAAQDTMFAEQMVRDEKRSLDIFSENFVGPMQGGKGTGYKAPKQVSAVRTPDEVSRPSPSNTVAAQMAVQEAGGQNSNAAADTLFASMMIADQKAADKSFVGPRQGSNTGFSSPFVGPLPGSNTGWTSPIQGPMQGKGTGYNKFNRTNGEGGDDVTKLASAEFEAYAESQRRATDATNEAAKSTAKMSAAMSKAIASVGEIASVAMSGDKTQMDEFKLAAKAGMPGQEGAESVRGIRDAFAGANVDRDASGKAISAFADIASQVNDPMGATSFAVKYANFKKRGIKDPSIAALPAMTHEMMYGKSTKEIAAMFMDTSAKLSGSGQVAYAGLFGQSTDILLASGKVSGEDIMNAHGDLSDTSLEHNVGVNKGANDERNLAEEFSQGGETAGRALRNAQTASKVLSSNTASTVKDIAIAGGSYLAAKVGLTGLANATGNAALRTAATLGGASVAIPATMLGGVLYSTSVYADALENDPDSVLGKMAQNRIDNPTFMPGPMGSSQGTNAVAEGIMNWWNKEDAPSTVPSSNLGSMSSTPAGTPSTQINSNVIVNVEIDEDGVKTNVNDNGKSSNTETLFNLN